MTEIIEERRNFDGGGGGAADGVRSALIFLLWY